MNAAYNTRDSTFACLVGADEQDYIATQVASLASYARPIDGIIWHNFVISQLTVNMLHLSICTHGGEISVDVEYPYWVILPLCVHSPLHSAAHLSVYNLHMLCYT